MILITHNVNHAYLVGDRFSILDRGQARGMYTRAELTPAKLLELMGGGAELKELEHELEGAGVIAAAAAPSPPTGYVSDHSEADRDARMAARPTIGDVATRSGVSTATVSRVLSGASAARPTTRARVLAAARELDYRPSAVARALKVQATRTIGLIVTDIQNPFFPQLVSAIEAEAVERGYGLVLCNTSDDPARDLASLDLLIERRVDGIMVASSRAMRRHGALLREIGVPVVLLNSGRVEGLPSIDTAQRRGARLAAEHLLELGHRRVGHITAPRTNAAAADRLAGVRDAVRAFGDDAELFVADGDGQVEGGADGRRAPRDDRSLHGDRLLQRPHRHRRVARRSSGSPRAGGHRDRRIRRHRPRGLDRPAAHHRAAADRRDGPMGGRPPRAARHVRRADRADERPPRARARRAWIDRPASPPDPRKPADPRPETDRPSPCLGRSRCLLRPPPDGRLREVAVLDLVLRHLDHHALAAERCARDRRPAGGRSRCGETCPSGSGSSPGRRR